MTGRRAYVAVARCGCTVAVMVAGISTRRDEHTELRGWVRRGLRIEVTTVDAVRDQHQHLGCAHVRAGFSPTVEGDVDGLIASAYA